MTQRDRYSNLLEVYELSDILDALGLESVDVLELLDEQGLLDGLELPEPLGASHETD